MPATDRGQGWKWDVTIYDRPGWIGRFRGRARAITLDGERIFVRFEEVERSSYYGDYFMGSHIDTALTSPDGGRTWERAVDPPPMDGVVLPDGTRLMVTHRVATLRGEKLRAYLEEGGLGDLWRPESFAWWNMRAVSWREELTRRGLSLHTVTRPREFLAYLGDLTVGICPPGATNWTWTPIEGLPPTGSLGGWWRQTGVVLDDGAVVGNAQGRYRVDDWTDSSFALRSADSGRTWELHPIALASGDVGFNEAFMLTMSDGRILAMVRTSEREYDLYRTVSADGGRTWSPLERTPIRGLTAYLLRLDSGAILCTYTRRHHPHGIRGVLSFDDGATWDVANEKILRDDAVGSVGYSTSLQLADGSIFTAYELGKPVRSPEEEAARPQDRPAVESAPEHASHRDGVAIDMEARPQAYVAGSRYTADYIAPLGR